MPQIGWFEILVIVILAILVIGPKDFPVMIKKVGNWIGSFKRYFAVKINADRYLELDLPTYKKLKKQSSNWTWELWNCFNIQWTLTGDAKIVGQTNRNQVLIVEQRLKRVGLQIFLRGNYLKYYQS